MYLDKILGDDNLEASDLEEIKKGIESTKKRLKNIDVSSIDKKEGMYFIWVPDDFEVYFESKTAGPKEIDGENMLVSEISLNNYYNANREKYLLVGQDNNLQNVIKKFLDYKNKNKSERIIWQIRNFEELYLGYHYSTDSLKKKNAFLDFFKKDNSVFIGNHHFKSNDAIASWSGFNYQGKVTILKIIQHINQLIKEDGAESISSYHVELEKTEDFVIYKDDVPMELYQVKAKLSSFTNSSYKDAIDKLIINRGENIDATCFLISAVEIKDWNLETAKDVKLYKYASELAVEMKKVPQFIKMELQDYFTSISKNLGLIEIDYMYNDICQFIDEKVAEIHSTQGKKNYSIKYQEFTHLLNRKTSELEENIDAKIKEKVYDFISEDFNEEIDNFCEDCLINDLNPNIHCSECALNPLRDNIMQMNFERYSQILRFHENKSLSGFSPMKALDRDSLRRLFLEFMHVDIKSLALYLDHNLISLEDEKIIPTEMNFEYSYDSSLSRAFEIMQKNDSVHDVISGKILTAKFGDRGQIAYLENLITAFPEDEMDILESTSSRKYAYKDSISEKLDFKIIDREMLIEKLKEQKDGK